MTSDDVLTRVAPPPDFVVCYALGPGTGAGAGRGAGAGEGPGAGGADGESDDGAAADAGAARGAGALAGAGGVAGVCGAAGADSEHVADVRLPPAPARRRPAPLVLFLHGGFWRAAYDRAHTGPLAAALAAAGFVVCVPEFRRTGQTGGGWPRTFDDVAAAVDKLPVLVREVAGAGVVSDGPVILGGHSAGGHLALWAAARHRLPAGSRWRAPAPSGRGMPSAQGLPSAAGTPSGPGRIAGVVALAAVSDLAACHALRLGGGAAAALLGGAPRKYPERYEQSDPARLLPLGCPVRLVHGTADDVVPCFISSDFLARARAAGDDVTLDALPGAGHYDVIDPLSAAWPSVLTAFGALSYPE